MTGHPSDNSTFPRCFISTAMIPRNLSPDLGQQVNRLASGFLIFLSRREVEKMKVATKMCFFFVKKGKKEGKMKEMDNLSRVTFIFIFVLKKTFSAICF